MQIDRPGDERGQSRESRAAVRIRRDRSPRHLRQFGRFRLQYRGIISPVIKSRVRKEGGEKLEKLPHSLSLSPGGREGKIMAHISMITAPLPIRVYPNWKISFLDHERGGIFSFFSFFLSGKPSRLITNAMFFSQLFPAPGIVKRRARSAGSPLRQPAPLQNGHPFRRRNRKMGADGRANGIGTGRLLRIPRRYWMERAAASDLVIFQTRRVRGSVSRRGSFRDSRQISGIPATIPGTELLSGSEGSAMARLLWIKSWSESIFPRGNGGGNFQPLSRENLAISCGSAAILNPYPTPRGSALKIRGKFKYLFFYETGKNAQFFEHYRTYLKANIFPRKKYINV